MAKIKFYKLNGLQTKGKKINSIDTSDNFKEMRLIKSELLKRQCATRIKAKDIVLLEQAEEKEKDLKV